MDANFRVDLNAIREVIESTDVFLIRFGQIEQRLLVDARPDEGGAPFIKIVPPVRSAEGRYRYRMKLPEQITVFRWPQSAQMLKTVGLWKRIEDRFFELGGLPAVNAVAEAFDLAVKLERADMLAAIQGGEGYETVWSRVPEGS